jgi:hypothetical protein
MPSGAGAPSWTQQEVGTASDTSGEIVRYFETEQRVPARGNLTKIGIVFANAGVQFIEEEGRGVGVKMRGAGWPAVFRAARALIRWTHADVAEAAGVAEKAVGAIGPLYISRQPLILTSNNAAGRSGGSPCILEFYVAFLARRHEVPGRGGARQSQSEK